MTQEINSVPILSFPYSWLVFFGGNLYAEEELMDAELHDSVSSLGFSEAYDFTKVHYRTLNVLQGCEDFASVLETGDWV